MSLMHDKVVIVAWKEAGRDRLAALGGSFIWRL